MLLKNITISGLGGVGGYYGAMLVEAARREGLGRTISFVARGAHRAAIEERGLHVHTPERDFTVRPDYLAEDPHDLPPTDLLILATKSYDLEANIQQLRPIITPRTIILPPPQWCGYHRPDPGASPRSPCLGRLRLYLGAQACGGRDPLRGRARDLPLRLAWC